MNCNRIDLRINKEEFSERICRFGIELLLKLKSLLSLSNLSFNLFNGFIL